MSPPQYRASHSNGDNGRGHYSPEEYAKKWEGSMLEKHADPYYPSSYGPAGGPAALPHNDASIINPAAPPPSSPETRRNHDFGLRSPPDSTTSQSARICCGRQYGSKFTFDRHRRESRTCPYGDGGRNFHCYTCATVDRPFGRRNTLKQHVREVHRLPEAEAKALVDTWYGRYGTENDYPEAMVGLEFGGQVLGGGGVVVPGGGDP